MTFTSPVFALFAGITLLFYWMVFSKSSAHQNSFLLVTSLLFYFSYNWYFGCVLIISILVNFYLGQNIAARKEGQFGKLLFWTAIVFNLGLLLGFKYFNLSPGRDFLFPFDSYRFSTDFVPGLIFPLGISFYTLQVLSYIIDVNHGLLLPSRNLVAFSTYVSYFPKITAGPIEPARKFLPQLHYRREFNYALASDGMRQILWGLFTKIVIANNCASITDPVFSDYDHYPGSTLILGAFLYIFQVYCDFSGYSNMAIGISKLLGIELTRNFHAPFFSTSIREYWQKWHMTLTNWMITYIFNPVAFILRRFRKIGVAISIVLTFLVVGFWHGPKWTYIVFGLLHGLYFIPLLLSSTAGLGWSKNSRTAVLNPVNLGKMSGLFILVMFTCIFFGSGSVHDAIAYIQRIFSASLFSRPAWPPHTGHLKCFVTIFFICLLLAVEWIQKKRPHELNLDHVNNPTTRRVIYFIILLMILLFGSVNHLQFQYANF